MYFYTIIDGAAREIVPLNTNCRSTWNSLARPSRKRSILKIMQDAADTCPYPDWSIETLAGRLYFQQDLYILQSR